LNAFNYITPEMTLDSITATLRQGNEQIRQLSSNMLERDDVAVPGYLAKMEGAYCDADVFMLPSLEEGSPLVTYEALGMGLPLIVSPMGDGCIAAAGRGVVMVDPYAEEALIDALCRLANDVNRHRCLSDEVADEAQRFTWDRAVRQRCNASSDWLHRRQPTASNIA
jgi:glycosyltransferase involved in cell wall biosynthesis